MLKKLQVLAGALRLTAFTVAELSEACGVSPNTVHTALSRVPEDWLKSTVVPGGARGGQRRRYTLSSVGISGIRGMLGRLPSAASSILVEPTDEPIGLSAARASLGRIAQVNPSAARVLREDALRSLEWAEAEIRDGEFASDAQVLRGQIDALRAQIEGFSDKDRKPSGRNTKVSIARSEEYLQTEGRSVGRSLSTLASGDAVLDYSDIDDWQSAPTFFIGYLRSDDMARQMASFANGALSLELHKRGEHRFVTEALELRDLFDSRIRKSLTDADAPVRLLICIGGHWNSPEIDPILEKASRFNEKGPTKRAWVLDHDHRVAIESVTRRLSLQYEPHAQKAEHLTRWIDATISGVDREMFATAGLDPIHAPRFGLARTTGSELSASGHASEASTLVPIVSESGHLHEETIPPAEWGVSVDLREADRTMERLETAFANSEVVTGTITGRVKGGFAVEIDNIRAFLPAALVDANPERDTSSLENKPLGFKVVKIDRVHNLAVVSRRAVIEQEQLADQRSNAATAKLPDLATTTSTLTKSELIEIIAAKQKHLPAKDVKVALKQVLEIMSDTASRGGAIQISGFGSFSLQFSSGSQGDKSKKIDMTGVSTGRRLLPLAGEPPERPERSGEIRTIKKYPNKRLYDTTESRYITLSDIRRLVADRIDFVIVDKRAQEDVTRSILLQVIAEQEYGVEPLMSRDFLSEIIRSYGGATQGMISSYLEQSLKLFLSQRRESRLEKRSSGESRPIDEAAKSLAQRNWQRWRLVQDEIYRTLVNAGRGGSEQIEDDKVGAVDWTPAGAPKE